MDPSVWILPAFSLVEDVSPVDVPTKLKAAVADSSVSPVPEIRMNRWKRQRNVQGVLGVHVLVGGGNLAFQEAVQWLRTELEFGTWDQSRLRIESREQSKIHQDLHVEVCSRNRARCQERVQRHTMEHVADVAPMVPSLAVPEPQMVDQLFPNM